MTSSMSSDGMMSTTSLMPNVGIIQCPSTTCLCRCDGYQRCHRRPGRRIYCPVCGTGVGPGCCRVQETQTCHRCVPPPPPPPAPPPAPPPEPDPEPRLCKMLPRFDFDQSQALTFLSQNAEATLLVDTGAFQNLCSDKWLNRVQEALDRTGGSLDPLYSKIIWEKLETPHPIRGVANEEVKANYRVKVPIGLPGGGLTYYEGLLLEGNNTPGLLGMSAMKKTNTVLDLRPGQMCMYSGSAADTIDITIPKNSGYKKYKLIESSGGHILLSCANYFKAKPVQPQVSQRES